MKKKSNKFATRAIHSGLSLNKENGAIVKPIYQNTTYQQDAAAVLRTNHDYGRTINPTRTALEENLAVLENLKYALTFSSGCSALSTVLQLISAGDHLILSDDVYGGSYRIVDKIYKRLGIEYSLVDCTNQEEIEKHIKKNTKLLIAETPSNPLLKIIDLDLVSQLTKANDILFVVDNTLASPYVQRPGECGADIVLHSTSKYIGGHSDVIGGALLTDNQKVFEDLKFIQNAIGAIPSPMDCFLLIRSIKTLKIRMDLHSSNALKIAEFLESHKKVTKVYYPGLVSHPQHQLAKKQMRGFSGVLSFNIDGGLKEVNTFFNKLNLFTLAESLGAVESLIEHPATMTHPSIEKEIREKIGVVDSLVRISVGLEDVDDLIIDLGEAL